MFRGDGSRAQKLENRWNCLNSFVDVEMSTIFGARSINILNRMQKAVLSSSLNIVRIFKVITK